MATLVQIRDKANAKLTPFWQMLIAKQPDYFLKHGKFFQLLVTSPVVDGVDTSWQLRTPADEQHVVDVDFPWTDTIPFQVSVDEFVGDTIGFSATATVQLLNGDKYRRTRKATAIVQEEVWTGTEAPYTLVSPRMVTSFIQDDTDWQLIEAANI